MAINIFLFMVYVNSYIFGDLYGCKQPFYFFLNQKMVCFCWEVALTLYMVQRFNSSKSVSERFFISADYSFVFIWHSLWKFTSKFATQFNKKATFCFHTHCFRYDRSRKTQNTQCRLHVRWHLGYVEMAYCYFGLKLGSQYRSAIKILNETKWWAKSSILSVQHICSTLKRWYEQKFILLVNFFLN